MPNSLANEQTIHLGLVDQRCKKIGQEFLILGMILPIYFADYDAALGLSTCIRIGIIPSIHLITTRIILPNLQRENIIRIGVPKFLLPTHNVCTLQMLFVKSSLPTIGIESPTFKPPLQGLLLWIETGVSISDVCCRRLR